MPVPEDPDAPTASTCISTAEDCHQSEDFAHINESNELLYDETGEKTDNMEHRDDSLGVETDKESSDISDLNSCFDGENASDEDKSNYTDTSDYDEKADSSDCDGGSQEDDAEEGPAGMFAVAEQLLYNQATMSQYEFFISFMSIFNQHCLTYSCAADFLKLFGQVLPLPNFVPQTPHTLIEKFVNYDASTITHRCCGYCTMPLLEKSTCSKAECKSVSAPDSTFVEVRLDKQIQKLFSGS